MYGSIFINNKDSKFSKLYKVSKSPVVNEKNKGAILFTIISKWVLSKNSEGFLVAFNISANLS